MIVLVQPMYSKQELNADSNYVVYSQLIKGMLETHPEHHFYIIFPDDKSGYKYEPDGFFKQPNVTRIPQRISPRKLANAISYDASWYDKLFRKLAFDVVWVNLIEIAGFLRHAGASTYENVARPFIVGAHNYVIHDTLPYPFESMEHVALAQLTGAMQSDVHVFNSDHCEWMFFDNAGRFLNEPTIAKLKEKSRRIDYGILEPSLEYQETRNQVPVIAYNHRLQGYKNYNVTFALLDRLYKEGLKFSVHYLGNTAEHTSHIQGFPFVSIRLCETREQYLNELRQCDLNITNSQHETFCIAAIESMALGQPLIAPNGVTFPQITNVKEGYPYLFDNEEEQAEMVRTLLTNQNERTHWGKWCSKHVRKSYNNKLWSQRYSDLFGEYKATINSQPDALEFLAKTVAANEGATLETLYSDIKGKVVNGRVPYSNQSLTPTKLLRLIRQLGARVVVEDGQERIRT